MSSQNRAGQGRAPVTARSELMLVLRKKEKERLRIRRLGQTAGTRRFSENNNVFGPGHTVLSKPLSNSHMLSINSSNVKYTNPSQKLNFLF
jgi:hypothetical protein